MSKQTEALIKELSGDLEPVKRLSHPLLRVLPWMALACAYVAGVVYTLGVRPDISARLVDPIFLFETSLLGFVALSAALVSSWLCVPDMRGKSWMAGVPLTALGVFALWTTIKGFSEGLNMPAIHWDHCFNDGALMGFVPMAAVVFFARGGTTTHPVMMSLMNTLSVGALGYVGLRLTCIVDTVGHACFYHFFPFVVLGLVTGVFARKLYRW
jgi:hypothetical protein